MIERFTTIYLGNPYECVIKDHLEYKTYGTISGEEKAIKDLCGLLNRLSGENIQLKEELEKSDIAFRCLLCFILKAPNDDVEELVRQMKAFYQEVNKLTKEDLEKMIKDVEEL